jgi:hypothetical protein
MSNNNPMKYPLIKIHLISLFLTVLLSIIVWFITEGHSIVDLSDQIFMTSVFVACGGVVISITSKSRRHYYKHLQKQFSGKEVSTIDFEKEQAKRDRHSQVGVSVGLAGVVGFILAGVVLFLN